MNCMRARCLSGLLLLLHAYLLSFGTNASARPAVTCLPHEVGQAELRTIRGNFYSVTGRLGGFDPCDRSVRFCIPEGISKPPLMISVHGGGGISDVLNSNEVGLHR
jgi:poly(3-hydroxybutyrate) depolymerase